MTGLLFSSFSFTFPTDVDLDAGVMAEM